MGVMIKSEDLKEEDLLCIWGFKLPNDPDVMGKVIHHALVETNFLSTKEKFRIIYFHSEVNGKGYKIPKLIKKICKSISKDMRRKLSSFDIVHPNFSLKCALFFFDKLSFVDYKIHFVEQLEEYYLKLGIEQKTFVLGVLPAEIKLCDAGRHGGEKKASVVGVKKGFKKDVVSCSESKYKNFDVTTAVQTYDILGKHISEFPREEPEVIPEIFTLIF